jgi:phospholipase/lecithinase/hemolysin
MQYRFWRNKSVNKELAVASLTLLSVTLPFKAMATSFSQIFVFGDSLSDTGNLFAATQQQLPPSSPYFQGRASNGPLWIEYFAADLGLSQSTTNFALGGATTGRTNTFVEGLPGLSQQIQGFVTTYPQADQRALYVIWAGNNDYLSGQSTNPAVPVQNLINAISALSKTGARKFLVVNLPNLGQLPATRSNIQSSQGLSLLSASHNAGLRATLPLVRRGLGVRVTLVNVDRLFRQALTIPSDFGFTNVTEACLNQTTGAVCPNPEQYLFWDGIHPTTQAHQFIAQFAQSSLQPSSVPQFSSGLSQNLSSWTLFKIPNPIGQFQLANN